MTNKLWLILVLSVTFAPVCLGGNYLYGYIHQNGTLNDNEQFNAYVVMYTSKDEVIRLRLETFLEYHGTFIELPPPDPERYYYGEWPYFMVEHTGSWFDLLTFPVPVNMMPDRDHFWLWVYAYEVDGLDREWVFNRGFTYMRQDH